MHFKLLSCEVFAREISTVLTHSPHKVTIQFLPKGLHEIGAENMRARLQEAIDTAASPRFDAVLLAYGLCSNGTAGLKARSIPVVLPRGHDCITLLLGSRERYEKCYFSNPGTYFRSTGWSERRGNPEHLKVISVAEKNGLNSSRNQLKSSYGEEAGEWLSEVLGNQTKHYTQLAFIDTGTDKDGKIAMESCREAAANGWDFTRLRGDLRLLQQLVRGEWDAENFLVAPPGTEIAPSYNDKIVKAVPVARA
jgi:hypothetical protein